MFYRIGKHSGTVKLISDHYRTHHGLRLLKKNNFEKQQFVIITEGTPAATEQTTEMDKPDFVCPTCGENYASALKLEWHTNSHNGIYVSHHIPFPF